MAAQESLSWMIVLTDAEGFPPPRSDKPAHVRELLHEAMHHGLLSSARGVPSMSAAAPAWPGGFTTENCGSSPDGPLLPVYRRQVHRPPDARYRSDTDPARVPWHLPAPAVRQAGQNRNLAVTAHAFLHKTAPPRSQGAAEHSLAPVSRASTDVTRQCFLVPVRGGRPPGARRLPGGPLHGKPVAICRPSARRRARKAPAEALPETAFPHSAGSAGRPCHTGRIRRRVPRRSGPATGVAHSGRPAAPARPAVGMRPGLRAASRPELFRLLDAGRHQGKDSRIR